MLIVRRDNDPKRDMKPHGIVRAIGNLLAAAVSAARAVRHPEPLALTPRRRAIGDAPRWAKCPLPPLDAARLCTLQCHAMQFAICNELFEGWAFDRVCRFVKQVGYEGLELAPFTLAPRITDVTKPQRAELRRQAADAGVAIIGLHWLLAKTEGLYLTSPDAGTRARTADYLIELAEACADLGGQLMVFGSPKQRSLLPGTSALQAFDSAAETFRRAMPAVARHGVSICMEPLAPADTDFINTCDEALQLIEAVAHRNFVLHLDVKAMSAESTPVPDLIRRHAGRAGHFHANDANLRGPGFGDTDFVPIFQALRDAGYNRWISVEVFDYTPDPETIARKSLEHMRTCLTRSS
jgi:sugar phosphate isomerase/epimerase